MDKRFKVLDDDATADIAYVVYGNSLKEIYENAAIGLFSILTDIEKVDRVQTDLVVLTAEDREALLLDFLNELLYSWEVGGVLPRDFSCEIDETDGGLELSCECEGELFDPEKHEIKAAVKAVTYFDMEITQEDGSWKAKVTLDV